MAGITALNNNSLFPIYMGKITILVESQPHRQHEKPESAEKLTTTVSQVTASTSGNVKTRRGFAAILCLKDRNTRLCRPQQR